MKKIALVFLLAVFVPSLVLAWLAVRSLRDQQLVLERQQSLLYQGVADALAKEADNFLIEREHEFGQQVEALLAANKPQDSVSEFDNRLRAVWPPAEVGFVVTMGPTSCALLSPSPNGGEVARAFYAENGKFVSNIQPAEVYSGNNWNSEGNLKVAANNYADTNFIGNTKNSMISNQKRIVIPQQQAIALQADAVSQQFSKTAPAQAEFRQVVGDSTEGTVARFLENKLKVLVWYRAHDRPDLIFGAQLSLAKLKQDLVPVVQQFDPALRDDIAVALLDDNTKPAALSKAGFQTDWRHPFVATELGEGLPHWEMAVYLLNPAKLAQSAHSLRLTLGSLIGLLLLAIGVGGWLLVTDLNRQISLARVKTDFVSNVSHELKTPLTSIRMFAELLAEGRVSDAAKSRSYLNIISAEASRLTRLINNVLDFSRLERGEKKYSFEPCDLAALLRETAQTYRPHLEANGFKFQADLPDQSFPIRGDRDALAQVMVNLLSNAEKYSNGAREITLQIEPVRESPPRVDARVLDRGLGVPGNCEEKIFEQFFRAHDSLSSGIEGSGLGLTLARQIARAHGGDVFYRPREGGGSCFTLRLPLEPITPMPPK